jgi:hypothetical protein
MGPRTDYDRTLAGLEACRWQQMQVIADAADDAGDAVLAAGWRWLAEHRKWVGRDLVHSAYYVWCPEHQYHAQAMLHPLERGRPPETQLPRGALEILLAHYREEGQREPDGGDFRFTRLMTNTARAVGEWLMRGRPDAQDLDVPDHGPTEPPF